MHVYHCPEIFFVLCPLYASSKTNVEVLLELLKIVCMLCMCLLQSTFCENNGILFNVTHARTDQLQRVLFLDGLCWQQAAERAYIRRVGEDTSYSLFSFCSK